MQHLFYDKKTYDKFSGTVCNLQTEKEYMAWKLVEKLHEKLGYTCFDMVNIGSGGYSGVQVNSDSKSCNNVGFALEKDGFMVGVAWANESDEKQNSIQYKFSGIFDILEQSKGGARNTTSSEKLSRVVSMVAQRVNYCLSTNKNYILNSVIDIKSLSTSYFNQDRYESDIDDTKSHGRELLHLLDCAINKKPLDDSNNIYTNKLNALQESVDKFNKRMETMPEKIGKPFTVVIQKGGMYNKFFIGDIKFVENESVRGKYTEYEVVKPFGIYDSIEDYEENLTNRALMWKIDIVDQAEEKYGEYMCKLGSGHYYADQYHFDEKHDICGFRSHSYSNENGIENFYGIAFFH